MTVGEAMGWARQLNVPRLDAQVLLAHLLGRPRSWVLAHDDAVLTAAQAQEVRRLLQARADAVPVAYLTGEREFFGLSLRVTSDVLVPRPETEVVVEWALSLLPPTPSTRRRVLDLGTGSGAIALALKHTRPAWEVVGTDCSIDALTVARGNAERLGLAIDWHHGAWWQAVGDERFDLIVSNPPYVAEHDPHLADLRHEPRGALTPGGDGLDALRTLAEGAPAHLHRGAWIVLEHGHDQAEAVARLLRQSGLVDVESREDLAGVPRCTAGRAA